MHVTSEVYDFVSAEKSSELHFFLVPPECLHTLHTRFPKLGVMYNIYSYFENCFLQQLHCDIVFLSCQKFGKKYVMSEKMFSTFSLNCAHFVCTKSHGVKQCHNYPSYSIYFALKNNSQFIMAVKMISYLPLKAITEQGMLLTSGFHHKNKGNFTSHEDTVHRIKYNETVAINFSIVLVAITKG